MTMRDRNQAGIHLEQVRDHYDRRLKAFGANPQGVDWGSEQRQEKRFEELTAMMPRQERFSLLDMGCGYGALLDYLKAAGLNADYAGLDISDEMIAEARRQHPDSRFAVGSTIEGTYDHVLASGIFNVMRAPSRNAWQDYVFATIAAMHAASNMGCSFNFLTMHSDEDRKKDDLYYADPGVILDFCIRNLSRDVHLSHHYGIWDFTVHVRGGRS